jgi:predicted Zn-dependent protease with MMP-like domain
MVRAVGKQNGDSSARELGKAWERLNEGDLEAAKRAFEPVRKRTPDAPEVLELQAELLAANNEGDAAVEICEKWASIEPENPRPWIQAAEISLYSALDAGGALEYADRALELVDEEADLVEAVLIKAEALIEGGRTEELDVAPAQRLQVTEALGELDSSVLDDPELLSRIGGLYLEVEDTAGAERTLRRILAIDGVGDEHRANALHGIGMARETRGDTAGAIEAWLEVRRLDELAPPAPWHVSAEAFEDIAEAAMLELPPDVIERLANVPILVEDLPSEDVVRDGFDPRLLGLFSGVPLPEKPVGGSPHLDQIHLYQRNLEASVEDEDELADQIRITVLHETAHFFGLDDDDLEGMGLG